MNNTTTPAATTLHELLADPKTIAWLDALDEPGDSEIREDLYTLRYITNDLDAKADWKNSIAALQALR